MTAHKARTHKTTDPFYLSPEWRRLRAIVLHRDSYRCVICKADVSAKGAARVDHILTRRARPDLELDAGNLRVLCSSCDNQSHREKPGGGYQRQERIVIRGHDANGQPLDPNHPWNRQG